MDQRPELQDVPPTTRVKPAMRGRALPLPPLVPLVGAFGVLLGFVLGFSLAPKIVPLPAPSPAAIAAASPSSPGVWQVVPEPAAVRNDELPPTDGLSLAQVLAAIGASGMGVSPTPVISARIVRYSDVSSLPTAYSDRRVWEIVARGRSRRFHVAASARALRHPALRRRRPSGSSSTTTRARSWKPRSRRSPDHREGTPPESARHHASSSAASGWRQLRR